MGAQREENFHPTWRLKVLIKILFLSLNEQAKSSDQNEEKWWWDTCWENEFLGTSTGKNGWKI